MDTISNRLHIAMGKSGMKQADIVNLTGINKGALSSYLSGRYKPKQNGIYKLAKALDVSEAWLMGLDVPMERQKYSLPPKVKEEKEPDGTDPFLEKAKTILLRMDDSQKHIWLNLGEVLLQSADTDSEDHQT